jgi:transcriptional regulator with XRE-family HTH domain
MTNRRVPFSGTKLLSLRALLDLRQQDLSDRTAQVGRRIERATISRYESGEATPSALNFGTLVRALECEPEDLLEETEAGAA